MNEDKTNFVSILWGYEQSKNFDEDKIFLFSESLDRTVIGVWKYMAPEMTMMMEESMKEIQKNIAPKISKNGVEIIHYMQSKNMKDGNKYNNKFDLYSIGVKIYNLYFGKFPFKINTFQRLITPELNRKIKFKIEEDIQLEDLIKKLLKENPDERINWEEYFEHPFFKQNNY